MGNGGSEGGRRGRTGERRERKKGKRFLCVCLRMSREERSAAENARWLFRGMRLQGGRRSYEFLSL